MTNYFNNSPDLCMRLLFPTMGIRAIKGKNGHKIEETKQLSKCDILLENICNAEWLITIKGKTEGIVQAIHSFAQNLSEDFSNEPIYARPPRIKGKGQTVSRFKNEDVQICIICPAAQCGAIIGKEGSRVKKYHQNTGAYVFVFNEYIDGEYLPFSLEKVISITGTPDSISKAVSEICKILIEEYMKEQFIVERDCYDLRKGATFFFDQEAHNNGFRFSNTNNNLSTEKTIEDLNDQICMQMGGSKHIPGFIFELQYGWGGMGHPCDENTFLQRVGTEKVEDGVVNVKVNSHQEDCIKGYNEFRLNEIKKMSGADVKTLPKDPDDTQTILQVFKKTSSDAQSCIDKCIWLMNLSINAFCDPKSSIVPIHPGSSLSNVVKSQLFGDINSDGNQVKKQVQNVSFSNMYEPNLPINPASLKHVIPMNNTFMSNEFVESNPMINYQQWEGNASYDYQHGPVFI